MTERAMVFTSFEEMMEVLGDFRRKHCSGGERFGCQACPSCDGAAEGGAIICRHADNPVNWESVLVTRCCYCGKYMGAKDGLGQTGVSHSICRDCWPPEEDDCG